MNSLYIFNSRPEDPCHIVYNRPGGSPKAIRAMNIETTLALLSIAGTAVFAASGALVAAGRGYDLVGAVFLSVASGLGGGTIVGVLAGTGVAWLKQPAPLWAALASAIVVFEAVRFVRGTPRGPGERAWNPSDPENGVDPRSVEDLDAVVHLEIGRAHV